MERNLVLFQFYLLNMFHLKNTYIESELKDNGNNLSYPVAANTFLMRWVFMHIALIDAVGLHAYSPEGM